MSEYERRVFVGAVTLTEPYEIVAVATKLTNYRPNDVTVFYVEQIACAGDSLEKEVHVDGVSTTVVDYILSCVTKVFENEFGEIQEFKKWAAMAKGIGPGRPEIERHLLGLDKSFEANPGDTNEKKEETTRK